MSTYSQAPKVYFQNLNALRFIAAFVVIISHIEQLKSIFNLPNYWNNHFVIMMGPIGVVLFFVLSGFLISSLLFKEDEYTGTISIKDFYIRRILRIWPLYFLIILSALLILPVFPAMEWPGYNRDIVWDNLYQKLLLYFLFLPNLIYPLYGLIPYASQTWSIGAEEQFYLVWPVLIKNIKNKWLLMIGVIFSYLLTKILLYTISSHYYGGILYNFWNATPIDCMAIGGLFALVCYQETVITLHIRNIIFNRVFQWFTLLGTILLIFKGVVFPFLNFEIYALLFGIIICNFAVNPQRVFTMEYPILIFLGKISYGLYMFHVLAIVISINILKKIALLHNVFLYLLVFLITITLSYLSFEFFEKQFNIKKHKYAKIKSGS